MRCSARRAAARPRCSTSSPASSTPSRRQDPVRRHGRHAAADREAQHRAGVPVSGDLRHHDGRTRIWLPAAQPRRAASRDRRARRARSPRCSTSTPHLDAQGARLTADVKQKISLGRGLVRSDVAAILFDEPLTVIDPAPEVGAALEAEGAAPRARPHHDLCHPRPDRGADLRRHGRRHVRRRGGADRHAGGTVRAPGAHLRRLFHRLARHERAAGRGRGHARRGSTATPIAARRAYHGLPPGATIEIGIRPEFVDVAPPGAGLPVGRSSASTISAASASPASRVGGAADRRDSCPTALAVAGDEAGARVRSRARSTSTPTAASSRERRDGQDRQPQGLVPGAAGAR